MQKKQGFTLIEILIVILIIGILTGTLIPKIQGLQSRARDAGKKGELTQINVAVNLYYTDNNTYKISGAGWMGGGQGRINLYFPPTYDISFFEFLKTNGYIKNVKDYTIIDANGQIITNKVAPCNPSGNQMRDLYMYYTDGIKYSLTSYLEEPIQDDIDYIQKTYNGTGANGTCTKYGRNFAIGN